MTREVLHTQPVQSEIAALERRNAWLERQVLLEKARVKPNYVERDLEGKTLQELSQLTSLEQAGIFRRVASTLFNAGVTEEKPLAPTIPVHNLEWNGENPHPTWKEVIVRFGHLYPDVARKINPDASDLSDWAIVGAIRQDDSIDYFSSRYISLSSFKTDISPIYAGAPDERGRMKENVPYAPGQTVAELLDFTRGVRGGLRIIGHQAILPHVPSFD